MKDAQEILELFHQTVKVVVEKSVRVEYLKRHLPKRYKTNRRIHKKFLNRFGLPNAYYDLRFNSLDELKPFQRKFPITLHFEAVSQPRRMPVLPEMPIYNGEPFAPSESVSYKVKTYTFPKVAQNLVVFFEDLKKPDAIKPLLQNFYYQSRDLIVQNTVIS